MKVTFYMVRHGQTVFNTQARIQGACDSPLTAQGIKDGQSASLALKNVPFTHAFSSTSERAMDTAKLILFYHPEIPLTEMKGLKEFSFGSFDGERFAEVQEEVIRRKKEDSFAEVGGENYEMISSRLHRTFSMILDGCNDGDQVLIVTHGLLILYILEILFGKDTSDDRINAGRKEGFVIPNGGITKFTYEDGFYELVCEPTAPQDFHSDTEDPE